MKGLLDLDWQDFFDRLYRRIFEADIFSSAAQVAFYFSFSLFPLLYFLVSLFGIFLESSEGLKGELYSYLRQVMPYSVFVLVRDTVDEIIENSTGGKATLGFVVTLWTASSGVDGIRAALNSIYRIQDRRPYWKTKLQSLLYTVIVCILSAAALVIVFYGWQLYQAGLARIGLQVSSPLILVSIQWVTMLAILLFTCELIYNLLPDIRRSQWTWLTAGSGVAIALWLLFSGLFRVYLGYFNTYNKAYGSLGAVMILMLWLYLTAMALLIGGAINAILHDKRITKSE